MVRIDKVTGIYSIINIQNNKIYIGKSVNTHVRWNRHKADLRKGKHRNNHLQLAWDKYGEDSFKFKIIEVCDKDKLNEREKYWILFYRTLENKYGYNTILNNEEINIENRNYRKQTETERELKGSKNPNASVLEEDVVNIKLMLSNGVSIKEIQKKTGIKYGIISSIKSLKTWEHILPELNDNILLFKNSKATLDHLTNTDIEEIKLNLIKSETTDIFQYLSEKFKISKPTVYRIQKCIKFDYILPELNEELKNKQYKHSIKERLTDDEIQTIRKLLESGATTIEIAKVFNVSDVCIGYIKNNKRHIKTI